MEMLRNYARAIILITLAVCTIVIWYAVLYWNARQNARVNFFSVGQGDAILIETPGGNEILVDGGPNDTVLAKLGRALPFWDRSIDLVLLTHPHADHVSGLVEVLKRYRVGAVIESGANYGTPEYKEWHALIREKNIPVMTPIPGERVLLGGSAVLDILAPFKDFTDLSLANVHDANIASKFSYGATSFLLMGDGEENEEYQMLTTYPARVLDADVLKVGHHGSKTSSSEVFLRAVTPTMSVIEVGKGNRYGHPHQEILDRLAAAGTKIFRTDTDGDVVLASDGTSVWRK